MQSIVAKNVESGAFPNEERRQKRKEKKEKKQKQRQIEQWLSMIGKFARGAMLFVCLFVCGFSFGRSHFLLIGVARDDSRF